MNHDKGQEQTTSGIGAKMARRVFDSRGNHSEVHLKEDELALLMQTAYDIGVKSMYDSARALLKETV